MNDISASLALAGELVAAGDAKLAAIVWLSLKVSLGATAFSCVLGMPLGALLSVGRFPGRHALIVLFNGLMGLPPVVVGLLVYLLLSRAGPLGQFGLLFTPTAMIIAQTVLITPIIAALTRQVIEDEWREYREQLRSLGASRARGPHAALERALLADHGRPGGLRPRGRRGRRGDDRRRQHRWRHARDDHDHRARNE
jgi:tungstate transport system permease protein